MKQITENIKAILSLLIVIFSFTYFFLVTITNIKAESQILIAIVGALTFVLNYQLGSSSGSSKKDEVISNLSNKQ